MTTKEAILKILETEKKAMTYKEVYQGIVDEKYNPWSATAKTPSDTVGAVLGDFIRNNDTRVNRVKGSRGFEYYLSKYENEIDIESIVTGKKGAGKEQKNTFQERDLHRLLTTYVHKDIYTKTVRHERSANGKDANQKWTHPDIIGVQFRQLKTTASQNLIRLVDKNQAFDLYSYELKKEIKTDNELKKYFFQAVSNSSWANYGYLVAYEILPKLHSEMKRLTASFGIGIIQLKANPHESTILFPARYHELDFDTIDKLCHINDDFSEFIKRTETYLDANTKHQEGAHSQLEKLCDKPLADEAAISKFQQLKGLLEE